MKTPLYRDDPGQEQARRLQQRTSTLRTVRARQHLEHSILRVPSWCAVLLACCFALPAATFQLFTPFSVAVGHPPRAKRLPRPISGRRKGPLLMIANNTTISPAIITGLVTAERGLSASQSKNPEGREKKIPRPTVYVGVR